MRKKTHDEYVNELKIKNPNVEVIETYINGNTSILHFCKIHNRKWKGIPSNILNGSGCDICKKEKRNKTIGITHEEYVELLKNINPDITPIEKYINKKTPILHKCNKHNITWKTYPYNILNGIGCIQCGNEKIGEKNSKTQEQYILDLRNKNPNIVLIDKYKGASNHSLHRCLMCNYEWMVNPADLLSGKGCPNCAGNIKKTPEEYKELINNLHPNIEVLDDYINIKTRIKHRCKIHDYVWETSPISLLIGSGCPICGREKGSETKRKTNNQYVEDLKKTNPTIINLEEYKGSHINILHKCLNCQYEWLAYPSNLLRGHGCPHCSSSKGEKEIKQWLENNNIHFIPQKRFNDCRDIKALPFDFYLDELNKCIEYDGLQHQKPIDFFWRS